MNINQFRIFWEENNTHIKEVIREFLCFIGGFVYENPVYNINDSFYSTEATDKEVINIFIYSNSKLNIEKCVNQDVIKVLFAIPEDYNLSSSDKNISSLLEQLIETIWNESSQETILQLLQLAKIFFDNNMFIFLQTKQLFQCYDAEVINPEYKFPPSRINSACPDYILDMERVFYKVFQEIENLDSQNVYISYARINIIRKMREIADRYYCLYRDYSSEFPVLEPNVSKLLRECDDLFYLDNHFLKVIFLAGKVCQTEAGLYLTSSNYFRFLLDKTENNPNSLLYSFSAYVFGDHCHRVYRRSENIVEAYMIAKKGNSYFPRVDFLSIKYCLNDKSYKESIEDAEKLKSFILSHYSENYCNLTFEELFILYRCSFLGFILCNALELNLSANIVRNEANAILQSMLESSQVRKLCSESDPNYIAYKNFCKLDVNPVRILIKNNARETKKN